MLRKKEMQMLYRNGPRKPTQDQLDAQLKKQTEEDEQAAHEFRKRLDIDRSIFSRD